MEINRQTYAEFFLLYIDRELDPAERLEVEMFIEQNPDLKQELELLQQVILVADPAIAFEDKSILYRKENPELHQKEERKRKIIPFGWRKMAAAAVVFLALGTAGWLFFTSRNDRHPAVVVAKNEVQENRYNKQESAPALIKKEAAVPDVSGVPHAASGKKLAIPDVSGISEAASREKTGLVMRAKDTRKRQEQDARPVPVKHTGIAGTDNNKNAEAPVQTEEQKIPGYAQPEIVIAGNEPEKEDVRNSVASFAPSVKRLVPATHLTSQPEIEFAAEDNNIIYFANTSLPKTTKLREVFRKATRVLEKVTSIGSGNEPLRRNDMVTNTQ